MFRHFAITKFNKFFPKEKVEPRDILFYAELFLSKEVVLKKYAKDITLYKKILQLQKRKKEKEKRKKLTKKKERKMKISG